MDAENTLKMGGYCRIRCWKKYQKMRQKGKRMKYLRWIAAAAAMVCSVSLLLPAEVTLAEESTEESSSFDDGTLTYTIISGTQVAVTDCVTSATNISIMPEIDGYDIVAIGDEAFANCENLMSLTIPSSVTSIGESAFYGCTQLQSLKIPDGVTALENGTFFQCSALQELDLGSGITSLGDMVFGYCTSLTELILPDSLETIGNQEFYYCVSLKQINIPQKVKELGSYTFYGCLSLTEFEIPAQLEEIGAMSFVACPALQTISVDENNVNYKVVDDVLYNAEQSILYLYPAAREETSFTVPDGVLVIYAGSFFSAANLQQITLNADLQYIGEMAFDFCSGLTSLTIPESVTNIESTAFADCTGLTSVTFAGASDEDGGEGEDLEIGDFAFFCCDAVKSIQLPKRVTKIGQYAFGCTAPEDEEEDSEDVVSVESGTGNSLQVKALDGFQLIGYTGAASDYVDSCELDIAFDSVNFDWKTFLFWSVVSVVLLAVILVAIVIVRKNMMTAEERLAKREARKAQEALAASAEPEFDDGYHSIVDDEEDNEIVEEVAPYEETISHAQLHQLGHAVQAAESESIAPPASKNADDKEKSTD